MVYKKTTGMVSWASRADGPDGPDEPRGLAARAGRLDGPVRAGRTAGWAGRTGWTIQLPSGPCPLAPGVNGTPDECAHSLLYRLAPCARKEELVPSLIKLGTISLYATHRFQ